VRMPDVYMRVQTTSKSITLGATCILLSAAIHFADSGMFLRAILIIVFLFITTPIAAHVLSRAAYLSGIPVAPETLFDELSGRYDAAGHLDSGPPSDDTPAK
jgi:multicomponent Na+:H+ antiporter subunit G